MQKRFIDGYKNCLNPNCNEQFAYRNTLIKRSVYCIHLKQLVCHKTRLFCSKKCSMYFRNNYENPAKTIEGKAKIRASALKRGMPKEIYSKESIEKRRKTVGGKGHWNWQGGKTGWVRKLRNCFEYIKWRTAVFKRDNYICQECGAKNGEGKTIKLNADHIIPFSELLNSYKIISFEQGLKCKKLWDIKNGKTLCLECHKKTPTFAGKSGHR